MRTRSPSSAPPENGDDGSTASTPTRLPCSRNAVSSAEVVVDLPTPGDPVRPMTTALPAWGVSAAMTSRSCGEAFSTRLISRPTLRGSPSRARLTKPATSTLIPLPRAWAIGGAACRHEWPIATLCAHPVTLSSNASPWPPPPHNAAAPRPPPRRRSSSAKVSASRAPDAPIGWPSAIAPPLTLTRSHGTPSSRAECTATDAKASLISIRSSEPTSSPARLSAFWIAFAGCA